MNRTVTLDRALITYWSWMTAHSDVPPTLREYADAVGLVSVSSAAYWLNRLIEAGYVRHAVPERRESVRYRANDLVLTTEGRAYVETLRALRAAYELQAEAVAS